ncbi:MAG: hypothetical protein ABIX01_13900 [Chitinophagaceae bacterium]
MKVFLTIFAFQLLCCVAQHGHAQSVPIDTAYPTSFAFTDATGNPLGSYLYNIDNVQSGFAVFEYTDGRKFVGSIASGQPDANSTNRIYYPDGTIYMGKTPVSNTFAPAAIYYPDGSLFVGSAGNYRERLGFLFAPDGSYMMGRFWWKKPYNFVTSYFDKNHNHLADKYSLGYDKPEMDLEEYLKIQKKEKPVPERDGNEKVVWHNTHKKYKYEGENIESTYIGWETEKWHIGIGGFAWDSYKHGDTTRITNGISHSVANGAYSTYTLPGFYANISISSGSSLKIGATREQWDTATMEFNTIKPQDAATNPERYMEYHIRNDGSTYFGEASYNRANGYGILYSAADGYTYFGDLAFGKKHGYGTLRYKDGSYIKGNWKDDKRFGMSKFYNAKGELTEEGDYVENNKVKLQKEVPLGYYALVDEYPIAKHEPPVYLTYVTKKLLTEGAVYTGNVSKNLPEGEGELTMSNGDVYTGKWHNGLPVGVCSIIYKPMLTDGKMSYVTYKGSLKDFGWDGLGHLTLDSNQFVGNFKDGQMNGYGTKIWPDGYTESGGWNKGQREGIIMVYNKDGYNLGFSTYKNGIKNGDSKEVMGGDKEAIGKYLNGKEEGQWTVYARNMHFVNGKMEAAPSRLGYIYFKNGVQTTTESNAEEKPDFRYHNPDDDIPVCLYCNGKGIVYTGEKFMGREIPKRCPRCNGKGRTWQN